MADTDYAAQGAALRRLREGKRRTQEALALAAGVSARTVLRAEKGEPVTAENLRALCAVLEVDVETLPPAGAPVPPEGGEGLAPAPTAAAVSLGGRVVAVPGWVSDRLGRAIGPAARIWGLLGVALMAWAVGQARFNPLSDHVINTLMLRCGAGMVLSYAGWWAAAWIARCAPSMPRRALAAIGLLAALPSMAMFGFAYLGVGMQSLVLAHDLETAMAARRYAEELTRAEGVPESAVARIGAGLGKRLLIDAFGSAMTKHLVAARLQELLDRPPHESLEALRAIPGAARADGAVTSP